MMVAADRSSGGSGSIREGYKILTHDWRFPTQGGAPLLNDATELPVTLSAVELDTTTDESGPGYHYCAALLGAARLSGFWPYGRSARCLRVMASEDAIERGIARRASALTLTALCSEEEIRSAMRENVWWAIDRAAIESLAREQWAWYLALERPRHDENRAIEGLKTALEHRGLTWTLKRFESPDALWAAGPRGAAREELWNVWQGQFLEGVDEVWQRLEVEEVDGWWDLNNAMKSWEAQWDRCQPWERCVANEARDTLTTFASSILSGMAIDSPSDCLTAGIRDAYSHGLAVAVPTGRNELGYAMMDQLRSPAQSGSS